MPTFNLADLDGSNGFKLLGDPADAGDPTRTFNGQRGFYLSGDGDVNADGFADIAIGGFRGPERGHLLFGGAGAFAATIDMQTLDDPGQPGLRVAGFGGTGTNVGVGIIGDINGDGVDDFGVGSMFATSGVAGSYGSDGVVAMHFGAANLDAATDVDVSTLDGAAGFRLLGANLNPTQGEQGAGEHIVDAGDVNGDGIADFAVASSTSDARLEVNSGEAFIIFGSAAARAAESELESLDGTDGFAVTGVARYDGLAVRGDFGDFDGDGFSDILAAGSDANPYSVLQAGEAYLIFGTDDAKQPKQHAAFLDGANGFSLHGITPGGEFGRGLDGSGDFNADGFDDLLIGAFGDARTGRDDAGAAYVVFGTDAPQSRRFDITSLDGADGFHVIGATPRDFLGLEASNAGDFNGDGFDDILLGAYFADVEAVSPADAVYNAGAAYLLFGGAGGFDASIDLAALDASQGIKFVGEAADDRAGVGARGVGDINGDGFDDIAIGAQRADSNGFIDNGAVYVVFGHATVAGTIEGASAANEQLVGNGRYNVLVGGLGRDDIRGGGGADAAHGGVGDDLLFGHAGNDRLFGDAGDDNINGAEGDDLLRGGEGRDVIRIGQGADIAFGEEGDDVLVAAGTELGAGDRLYGGLGLRDMLSIFTVNDVDLNLLETFVGFERIRASVNGNRIVNTEATDNFVWYGRDGDDDFFGGSGRDTMRGGGGNDTLEGGAGNDNLDGDAGSDFMTGGLGRDVFQLNPNEGVDRITDFEVDIDRVNLQGFGFSDFAADVQSRLATVNGETAFTASGSRLFFLGVEIGDLDAADFIL